MKRRLALSLLAAAAVAPSSAFYLPGAAPHDFVNDEPVDLFVNALTPIMGAGNDSKLVRIPNTHDT